MWVGYGPRFPSRWACEHAYCMSNRHGRDRGAALQPRTYSFAKCTHSRCIPYACCVFPTTHFQVQSITVWHAPLPSRGVWVPYDAREQRKSFIDHSMRLPAVAACPVPSRPDLQPAQSGSLSCSNATPTGYPMRQVRPGARAAEALQCLRSLGNTRTTCMMQ